MTKVGAGGVIIRSFRTTKRFNKDIKRLDRKIAEKALRKIGALTGDPIPPGLVFEKLRGKDRPPIYTIHVNGNFKVSMTIEGNEAILRRIGVHDLIDDNP